MTDVKQSIAIASPGISGGEGLAGWPWPGAAPVYPVFWLRLVLPVKGDVMTTSILVTGGTGTLGRPVAQRLRDAGASVTALSRHPTKTAEGIRYTAGDLSTGAGIEAAVRGAEVIVHCAASGKG